MNEEQMRRWEQLIKDCKSSTNNINVGGKAVRAMLIAADEIIRPSSLCPECDGERPADLVRESEE